MRLGDIYARPALLALPSRVLYSNEVPQCVCCISAVSCCAGADWEDDEAALRAAANGMSVGPASRAALAALSRRQREMMSDNDESDDDDDEGSGAGEGSSGAHTYLYNTYRQGVPDSLRRAAARDRALAAAGVVGCGPAPASDARSAQRAPNPRPRDYRRLLAGNIDDDFRLGISIRRRDVKLYSDFYDADIIVASPVALRRHIGGVGDKRRDVDFLSSIEVVVVDAADVLLQQNWEHVRDIFAAMNTQPREARNTDFSRVREWNLEGLSRYFRQVRWVVVQICSQLARLTLVSHKTKSPIAPLPHTYARRGV